MDKNTKIVLGIGALALIGWFIYKNKKQTVVVEETPTTDPDEELAYMMLASPMFHIANWWWNPTQGFEQTKELIKGMTPEVKVLIRKYALSENMTSVTESEKSIIMDWSNSIKSNPPAEIVKKMLPNEYTMQDYQINLNVYRLQGIPDETTKYAFDENYLQCSKNDLPLCKELGIGKTN
jgi:hypothetical protein